MIEVALVLTGYSTIVDGSDIFNTPTIFNDYSLKECRDITDQPDENIPASPNNFIVQIKCESAVMDAIEADENYTIMPGTRSEV